MKLTLAPHCPVVLLTVIFAGQLITGAMLSFTVIICVQVAKFPDGSVALYVLVIVYLFIQVWFDITSDTKETIDEQLSLLITEAILTAGTADAH